MLSLLSDIWSFFILIDNMEYTVPTLLNLINWLVIILDDFHGQSQSFFTDLYPANTYIVKVPISMPLLGLCIRLHTE